ncbi:MAG: flagellar biosynthesis anti-sigma factor FlgM [Candidatus Korobacteraceae bacterium]
MRIDNSYSSATAASTNAQRVRTPPNKMEPQDDSNAAQIQPGGAAAQSSATAGVSRTARGADTADISGLAPAISDLAAAVHTAPEVRATKVQALRQAVDQGTYQVSPDRIAQSMLAQATSKLR